MDNITIGKVNIDLKHYLEEDKVDYSNRLTNVVSDVNLECNDYLKKVMLHIFKHLKKLFS